MMTLRTLKLKEYERCEVTLIELKEVLLRWYYEQAYKRNPSLFVSDMERELIITEIKGSYGSTSSVVFSVNGSPPKGEAILFLQSQHSDYWIGTMICMGNGRISSRISLIKVNKGEIKTWKKDIYTWKKLNLA